MAAKPSRPRVLMIAPLPPPVHGSAMMTQYIRDSLHINRRFRLDWVNLSTSRRMDEIGRKNFAKVFRFFGAYFRALWLLLTRRYSLCYLAITCHGRGFLKDAPFVLLCKLFRRPIVIHQHNKGMSRDTGKPLYRRLFKAVYRNASVVLLSERLYPDIEAIVPRGNVLICPNGIPEVPRLPKTAHPRPVVLFLSNLIASKGVPVLLDACRLLKERGMDFECRFVGGETKEIDAERFAGMVHDRSLEAHVVYAGRRYGDEKIREFAGADVFVFPTSYINETFGLVLLEAMQQAVPVISTREGGIPDIVEDGVNGFVVDAGDAPRLADAIAALLLDPEKARSFGESGYMKYCEQYTLAAFEKNLADCLQASLKK